MYLYLNNNKYNIILYSHVLHPPQVEVVKLTSNFHFLAQCFGVNFLRNLRFLRKSASTTTPDLSHLFGCGPVWFWTKTLSPHFKTGKWWACWFMDSADWTNLVLRANSLLFQTSFQVLSMAGLSNLIYLLTNEKASRNGLPKRICGGDTLQSLSGVLPSCSMPCRKLSVSRVPDGPIQDKRNRLTFLTATSALPLDLGKYAEDILCFTPHRFKKSEVQGSYRAWKTWKTWKNTLILPQSGKSQGKKLGIEESRGKVREFYK